MLASAAAQETGLPPKVERWSPGLNEAAISSRVVKAASGKPSAMPLAVTRMSGSTAVMLDGEHFAGAAESGLHFVGDEKNAVAIEDFLDLAEIVRQGER